MSGFYNFVSCGVGSVVKSAGSVVKSAGSVVKSAGSVVKSAGSVVKSAGSVVKSAGSVVKSAGSVVKSAEVLVQEAIAQYHTAFMLHISNSCNQLIASNIENTYKIGYGVILALSMVLYCIVYTFVGMCINLYNNPVIVGFGILTVSFMWIFIYMTRLGQTQLNNLAIIGKDALIGKIDNEMVKVSRNMLSKTYVSKKEIDLCDNFD